MHTILNKILSFSFLCEYSPNHICHLVGENVEPSCFSRNIDFGETEIFSPLSLIIQVISLLMAMVMIFQVSQKYTAVGQSEFLMFLFFYMVYILVDMSLTIGLIPGYSLVYKVVSAVFIALKVALFAMLAINGVLVFQWVEDGVASTIMLISIICVSIFGGAFFVAFSTFISFLLDSTKPYILFIIYPGIPVVCAIFYILTQFVFIFKTLKNYWAIGNLVIGILALLAGLGVEYSPASELLCKYTKHYIDGSTVHLLAILFGIMMVYKYWVSITQEDLEFIIESTDDNYILEENSLIMQEKLESTEIDVLLKKEAQDFLNEFKSSLEKVEKLDNDD